MLDSLLLFSVEFEDSLLLESSSVLVLFSIAVSLLDSVLVLFSLLEEELSVLELELLVFFSSLFVVSVLLDSVFSDEDVFSEFSLEMFSSLLFSSSPFVNPDKDASASAIVSETVFSTEVLSSLFE